MRKIVGFVIIGLFLSACASLLGQGEASNDVGYDRITVRELQNLMETEDFTLINVHIPLEGSIPETDIEIPYNEMENYVSLLPENKNEKIIIYCRSGSMGDTASQTLVDLGFTDVSNLEGGYNLWKASGLPFEE